MRSIINEIKGWLLLVLSPSLMDRLPKVTLKSARYPGTLELLKLRDIFSEHERHPHRTMFLAFIDFFTLLYDRDEVYRERFNVVMKEIKNSQFEIQGKPRNQWWK